MNWLTTPQCCGNPGDTGRRNATGGTMSTIVDRYQIAARMERLPLSS
jgi:hypothetical protein